MSGEVDFIDENQPLSVLDDQINAILTQILSKFGSDTAPGSPCPLQDWYDSANDAWKLRNPSNTNYFIFYSFGGGGGGYGLGLCTGNDIPMTIGAPDTGTSGYRVNIPPGPGTAGQGWRVASIDGDVLDLEWFTPGSLTASLGSLTDVDLTGLADGDAILWAAAEGMWKPQTISAGGGATDLDGLTDVDIDTPANAQFVRHDGSSFKNSAIQKSDLPALILNDLADVSAVPPHTAGKFLKSNGSIYAASVLVEADISDFGSYLPAAGGTIDGDLLLDNEGELRLGDTAGSEYVALRSPSELAASYNLTLPSQLTSVQWNPAGGTGANLSVVLAFDALTGDAFFIQIGGSATGGSIVVDGTDEDVAAGGHAGVLNRVSLIWPEVTGWHNSPQSHDGSSGPVLTGSGDGSNTLDLRYAATLAENGGGPLAPEAGGTGVSAVPTGALLIGGAPTTIPAKAGVASAENNGLDTTPMAVLQGTVDGQAVLWNHSSGTWYAGTVPGSGVTDHGALTGLEDDADHPQYSLIDGTRPFTGRVTFAYAGAEFADNGGGGGAVRLQAASVTPSDYDVVWPATGPAAGSIPMVLSTAGNLAWQPTTGTGSIVRATSPAIATPSIAGALTLTGGAEDVTLDLDTITAPRAITIPDASGTLALLSDIPTDHGALAGLSDPEDHPQYSLIDGTRPFSGRVTVPQAGVLFNDADSSNGVTLQASAFTVASYAIVLPVTAPAINSIPRTIDGAGQLGWEGTTGTGTVVRSVSPTIEAPIVIGGGAHEVTLGLNAPSAPRVLSLPDKTGTLAVLADIPSVAGDDGIDADLSGSTVTITIFVTGQSDGDLLLRSGGAWVRLPAGSEGQVLTMVSGVPTWQDLPS